MHESPSTPRLPGALRRMGQSIASGAVRLGRAVRRHPVRAVLAIPLAFLMYAALLYPFTPSIGDIKKAKSEQPSIVLSADGKELAVFKRANRDWVKLEDISPNVVDALLATEDHRFWRHHGFDAKRTAKALFNTMAGDREGGSTLTQQLARNLYPEEVGRAPTVTRKIKELITALKIEAVYTKREILETYLNTVPFLYNAYGIEMAAQTYFDKPAKKLDAVEAATLVGMLKGTSYYNPVLNPERAIQRRNTVLAQMVKHGKLPAQRFEPLAKAPLKLDFERQPEFEGMAPHLAQNIRRWLIDWADRNDYNIHADGLVVRTTIDSGLQKLANEAVRRQADRLQAVADVEWGRGGGGFSTEPSYYQGQRGKVQPFARFWDANAELVRTFIRERPEYKAARDAGLDDAAALAKLRADAAFMRTLKEEKTRLQAGFLAMDPNNGQVRAWVGSRDYQDDKFDHVQQARRQPGSTFKPFVYAAALEAGARPGDTYLDQPVEIQVDRDKVWRPGDVGEYTGLPMTLRDGLVKSKNTITAQVMLQVGASRVAQLARSMGVRQSRLDEVPSLALGTSPVTLRELVSSYATVANGGNYIQPIVITSVQDRHGNTLESFSQPAPERALSNDVAQTLLDMMRGVVNEGTAVGLKSRFGLQGDLAGKTGTTQRNTDGWFIVMHPQLVAGAWMGFNDNRVTMRTEYWGQGAHNAAFIVGDFLQQAFRARALDAKATFAVPKDASKESGVWDPLWGRVNQWWNSVFPNGQSEAVVVQPTPLPPPLTVPPLQDQATLPEPLRLPDSGALPPGTTRPDTAVLGAPAPRAPDVVIPAPSTMPAIPVAPRAAAPDFRVPAEPPTERPMAATGSATGSATDSGSASGRSAEPDSAAVPQGSAPAQASGEAMQPSGSADSNQ
jgi:penicillin-binding protein 1A